jgi:serine protease Do
MSRFQRGAPQEDLFRYFFNQPRQREFRSTALGSGVIIDSNKGYVITNNHVVDDVDEINIRLMDNREFEAEIIGRDPKSDLAVLKIEPDNLVQIRFGDSDELRVGELVIAVGSPFSANLSHTVTAGIVSAKGRGNIIQGDMYEDFIQTDAAINPGNSGGALLNSSGSLIGINTAIYTNSFDSSNKGVGFAIPSNMVKQVMDDLVAYGKVVRSWIGVQIQALDESKAKALGLDSTNGALVADVVGDGPADKAGIETGDVIIEFNSQKVKTVDNLRNKVSASKPNKSYELLLIRDGKKKSMRVKLEEMPSDEVLIGSNVEESSNEIGIKVSSISRSLRNQYDLNAKDEGVVVVSVDENSPSDVAGIQPGDIITRVGTKKCTNPEQFQRLLNDTKKRNMVMLHLKRDGAARYLTLEVD